MDNETKTYHAQRLLRVCLHANHPRFHLFIPKERRIKLDPDLLLLLVTGGVCEVDTLWMRHQSEGSGDNAVLLTFVSIAVIFAVDTVPLTFPKCLASP
jgi:hypothetical protein